MVIDPPDADEEAEGYQVALEDLGEITVTVTSADGSRTKTYRVAFKQAAAEITLNAGWNTFEWPGADGVAIGEAGLLDAVVAVYHWDEASRTWLGNFPGLEGAPGLNTLKTFSTGATYWVAATGGGHLDGPGRRSSLAGC